MPIQDKFAATHGYLSTLTTALSKIPAAAREVKIDKLYSIYHNSTPQISERLEALEKLREDEEGTISLPDAVDEKV
jgi:STE24 endopeptidase